MAFWNAAAIEPKRNFRWTAAVNINGVDLKLALKKFKKPSFEIKATEHMYLNHKFNYPGRLNWKEIDFTLVNAANQGPGDTLGEGFDTVKTFMSAVIKAGYRDPSRTSEANASTLKTISKNGLVSNLGGEIKIRHLAPDGITTSTPIEEWVIKNPIITGLTMTDLDYTNEDISEVTVNLVYDYAVLAGTESVT